MFQWFKEPKIDFMRPRRIFLGLSGLACLAGVYAIVLLYQGKANLGTDFGAGVLLRMTSPKERGNGFHSADIEGGRFPGSSAPTSEG